MHIVAALALRDRTECVWCAAKSNHQMMIAFNGCQMRRKQKQKQKNNNNNQESRERKRERETAIYSLIDEWSKDKANAHFDTNLSIQFSVSWKFHFTSSIHAVDWKRTLAP